MASDDTERERYRHRALKWGAGITVAALLFLFILSLNARDNVAKTGTTSPPGARNVPIELGSTIERDGVALFVTSLRARSDSLGRYLCTTVTYTNHDDAPVNFNGYFDWKFQTPGGVQVTPALTVFKDQLSSGAVVPGGQVTGALCIDDLTKGDWQIINDEYDAIWKGSYA